MQIIRNVVLQGDIVETQWQCIEIFLKTYSPARYGQFQVNLTQIVFGYMRLPFVRPILR